MKKLLPIILVLISGVLLGQSWLEVQKTIPNKIIQGQNFGWDVDLDAEWAVIGMPADPFNTEEKDSLQKAGSVMIYKKSPSGTWDFKQKLTASIRDVNAQFGYSVSIHKDYLAVGAPDDERKGAVYLFKRNYKGRWEFFQKIISPETKTDDFFGDNIKLNGNSLLIGATFEQEDENGQNPLFQAGAIFYFKLENNSWEFKQKLVAEKRELRGFGTSFDVCDTILVVGRQDDYFNGNEADSIQGAGSCLVYKLRNDSFKLDQKLVASDRYLGAKFGYSVAIDKGSVVVGAPLYNDPSSGYTGSGAAYVYKMVGKTFEFSQRFGPQHNDANQYIGFGVDIKGKRVALGVIGDGRDEFEVSKIPFMGTIHLYEDNSTIYDYKGKVYASDGKGGSNFGMQLSLDTADLIVGLPNQTASGVLASSNIACGAFYCYSKSGIGGKVFFDENKNCQLDGGEKSIAGLKGIIIPGGVYVTTNAQGVWQVKSLAAGNYKVSFDTTKNWKANCLQAIPFTVNDPNKAVVVANFPMHSDVVCSSPNLSVSTGRFRSCRNNNRVVIHTKNIGDAFKTIVSPYVLLELDTLLTIKNSSHSYTYEGDQIYRFNISDLSPYEEEKIFIDVRVDCSARLGQTFCIKGSLLPLDSCALELDTTKVSKCQTEWDKSSLKVTGKCEQDSVKFTVKNTGEFGGGDMSCYSELRIFIDGALIRVDSLKLKGQESQVFAFPGDGRTWRLEADQHPKHPGKSRPNANVEACGDDTNWTPGLINNLYTDNGDPHKDETCVEVTGSYDPNDKQGFPTGTGAQHYIDSAQTLDYMIRFQNTGNDTAFLVVIRDTIDSNLDIYSIQVGASSHSYTYRVYGPRVLEFTFANILLPDSNVNEPASNGFVKYSIRQNAGLAKGTAIKNSAAIYFDFNVPIITNTTVHTIHDFKPDLSWNTKDTLNVLYCGTYPFNGTNYTKAGSYYNLRNDTLFEINLSKYNLDTTISVSNNQTVFTSNQTGANYKWLWCDFNYQEYWPSYNQQSFPANENASFAAEISKDGCLDTTSCKQMQHVGMGELEAKVSIYPNPITDGFSLRLDRLIDEGIVTIYSADMKAIDAFPLNVMQMQVPLNRAKGVYFVQIKSLKTGRYITQKLIKR